MQGRASTLQGGVLFQSAPLAIGRGDLRLEKDDKGLAFQSAPLAIGRGDA